MAIPEQLAALVGSWKGTNRLNLPFTPDPIFESPSNGIVRKRANGACLEIEYDWVYEGERREGFIVISVGKGGDASAVWTDGWHSKDVLMTCEGRVTGAGGVDLKGNYRVEGHPDWGWRTEIVPGADSFKYLMFNVSPEGTEEWAVETEFTRV